MRYLALTPVALLAVFAILLGASNASARSSDSIHVQATLAPHAEMSATAALCTPRVNGTRGIWRQQHSVIEWPKIGVAFDGIGFQNYGHHTVRVTATICQ
jgi:hypothetical protein